MTSSLMILVAGPYRSGTGDDPVLVNMNLRRLEAATLPLFEAGHLPVVAEWLSLPVARVAGSTRVGDEVSERYLYPTAARLLERCEGVLRLPGASAGADQDVAIARERGIPVWHALEDVPGVRLPAPVGR
ncbi:hypothetical protein GCM10023339_45260 [Alloalcanivorax gelatiniphagus]